MKKFFGISVLTLLTLAFTVPTHAQEPSKDAKPPIEMKGSDAKPADAPKEETWASDHTTRIGGQSISYKATASLTMLKDDKGEATALIFSTAYTRTDLKDAAARPIAFVYNGGPGSASIWLHMGAFGPRRVVNADAAATAPAPYKIEDNANSLLDKTDLVFIDPVGTGFSRAIGKSQNKDFWGVDQDVKIARAVHQHLPQPQQPLEFSEISDRRKLRHLPLRRPRKLSPDPRRHLHQRHRADFQRPQSRHHFLQPR